MTPAASWFRSLTGSSAERERVEIDGTLQPEFFGVAKALRRQIQSFSGGAAVCVYHRGECVVDLWGGDRNGAGQPWRADTMAPSFSTTKGVASVLVHMMIDRGLLGIDARVADFWPEFAQAGKQDITLRHVLTHQSGLYHIREMIDRADRMLDWDYMARAIERAEPIHPPGERTGYHGLTYGFIVGEILQRVTGERFPDLVAREIAEPLGLDGLYVGAPAAELHRAADLMWPERVPLGRFMPGGAVTRPLGAAANRFSGVAQSALSALGIDLDWLSIVQALAPRGISNFDFGSRETLLQPIPAGNGLFTARSLARMYAALAEGGEIDGVRLLSQDALRRATRPQREAPKRAVLPIDMRWRLGFHGIPTTIGMIPEAFGHFGFGGSGAWADPSRRLAVALIVNCGMGTPFGDTRNPRMGAAALQGAERRGDPAPRWLDLAALRPRSARRPAHST